MSALSLPTLITRALEQLPVDREAIAQATSEIWAALPKADQIALEQQHAGFLAHWLQVSCASRFVRHALQRDPAHLLRLADAEVTPFPEISALNAEDFAGALRRYRNARMVEIIWKDREVGEHMLETVTALSMLAETCLQKAYEYGIQLLKQRHGVPRNEKGEEVPFTVLGMGKLGGEELNLSSDIDLIFCYGEGGSSDGPRPLDNSEYFLRLGRWLIQTLDQRSADGFCFRVDMRLRPFGDAGPLCVTAAAMEQYYQHHGRGWERYAFIKARPVAGSLAFGQSLLETLRPFVYRRYLDYTALNELREVKALMDIEQGESRQDIKKGRGGIREIEFICQSLQIIYGGRHLRLRNTNTLAALSIVAEMRLLPAADTHLLRKAYFFLRNTEHCLQMLDDQQTQQLPHTTPEWQRLAEAMHYPTVDAFRRELDTLRDAVHQIFAQTLAVPDSEWEEAETTERKLWQSAQTGALETPPLELLQKTHFAASDESWTRLWRFAHSGDVSRRLSTVGRQRLDQLLPLILQLCQQEPESDALLNRFLQLIEAVLSKAHYLALLAENPRYLEHCLRLLRSPWLAQQLARFPLLLDDVLGQEPDSLEWPKTLHAQLQSAEDLEERMDTLRRFKNAEQVRLAAGFWTKALAVEQLLPQLSDLAQITLQTALGWAHTETVRRHGQVHDASGQPAPFAVIAFGKLGGREMGLASDLDLVFLYDAPLDAESHGPHPLAAATWFARLGQKLIHILGTLTRAGLLYEIDMRLRPSGQSGPLVTTMEAFSRYQQESAWTWEHQALTRARWVAGDIQLGRRFAALRQEILNQPRNPDALRADVRHMRRRIRESKSVESNAFHLKLSPGGLTDIEFLVQFAMLRFCPQHADLCQNTGTSSAISALTQSGCWHADQGSTLLDTWKLYRQVENERWLNLQENSVRAADSPHWEELQVAAHGVQGIWRECIGSYTD
ncbi:MAG: bifunctional [glutamate--ammonia ligase]-adenylyl-L-tyrosine phosphorylase/[glutamate--ammonia-ligase] adenylyltransferase [Acidithiobacillus sp.]